MLFSLSQSLAKGMQNVTIDMDPYVSQSMCSTMHHLFEQSAEALFFESAHAGLPIRKLSKLN